MSNTNSTPVKFTKEIKESWLKALNSGEFIQGYASLVRHVGGVTKHCCIGVLGEIIDGLDNESYEEESPYTFLTNTIGDTKVTQLWRMNDKGRHNKDFNFKGSYTNVIPLTESLPTQD